VKITLNVRQPVSSLRGGALVGLAPQTKLHDPQIETWNTINQCSFCQFLQCQALLQNRKFPYCKLCGDGSGCNYHRFLSPYVYAAIIRQWCLDSVE